MTLSEAIKLEGVKDLPAKQKLHFAKALIAENEGNHEEAQRRLEEAISAA